MVRSVVEWWCTMWCAVCSAEFAMCFNVVKINVKYCTPSRHTKIHQAKSDQRQTRRLLCSRRQQRCWDVSGIGCRTDHSLLGGSCCKSIYDKERTIPSKSKPKVSTALILHRLLIFYSPTLFPLCSRPMASHGVPACFAVPCCACLPCRALLWTGLECRRRS